MHTERGLGTDSTSTPLIEAADRFAAAARQYLEDTQASRPAAVEAARSFGDFLRTETMKFFRLPWSASTGSGGVAVPPPSMQDLPALGPTREHQLRWQRTADTDRRMNDAQQQLQMMWSDALREAAMAFAERLEPPRTGAANGAAPGIEALRGLYDSWIDCAEESYARIAHSDRFSNALADYMNAGSALRKEIQAGNELWTKTLDLPTRSELNALLRRVKILEEEQLRSTQARDAQSGPKS